MMRTSKSPALRKSSYGCVLTAELSSTTAGRPAMVPVNERLLGTDDMSSNCMRRGGRNQGPVYPLRRVN